MVRRMIVILLAVGAVTGVMFGAIAGLTVPPDRFHAWTSSPWKFGFLAGLAMAVAVFGALAILMRWKPMRRYVEGA